MTTRPFSGRTLLFLAGVMLTSPVASAQDQNCRFICDLEWKFEPTFTTENLWNRPRVVAPDGTTETVSRENVFELILALDMATKFPRLSFVMEAIATPTHEDNSVELEFESTFHWLTESMTRGWLSSHFDVVDQFSPADRPGASRAYTHKLDFELDTAFHLFQWLPEERWLRGLELETSLDYLATGIPKEGDVSADGTRYLDDASHWSFSFVIVIPIAPF